MSPEDYSRPVSPLGSSSTDPELLSARSAQAIGRGSCSVPNTPSRANLTASFNAVQQQADEGPILTTPAGSPKHGGGRPMLPEDSTDQVGGGSPPHTQAVHQEGDGPPQGAAATRDDCSHVGAEAGPAENQNSSSNSSSRGSEASQGVEGSLTQSRDNGSMGSSRKGSGSPGGMHASPASPAKVRASSGKGRSNKGSSSRNDSNQGSSNMGGSVTSKASSSRHRGSIVNSGAVHRGTVLSYKDKLLSAAPQAPASSSATASDSLSPASSVSSAQASAQQDPDGRSRGKGSQNSKSKGGVGSSVISADTGLPGGGTALHGGAPQPGAELAKAATAQQAGCSPQSSSPHHNHKVQQQSALDCLDFPSYHPCTEKLLCVCMHTDIM